MSASHAKRDEPLLIALLDEVKRARARFRAGRDGLGAHASRVEQQKRGAELALAMEAYAAAADRCGLPLSYRYRNEMRLYRSMAGPVPDVPTSR